MKILITNGDNLRTLSFFRAVLEEPSIEVHVAAERSFNACFFSKYCKHKLINANPKSNPELFLKQLSEYCKSNKIDKLIPMNANELELILKNKKLFQNTDIPFPDIKKFLQVKDKLSFAKFAIKAKVKVPKIYPVNSIADLNKITTFPVIVKIPNGASSKGVKKANNQQELLQTYQEIENEFKTKPFVQDYITGENLCSAAVCNKGKILSVSCFKAVRQLPVAHGTSTARISITDKKLEDETVKILKALKWHGIAHFDVIKRNDEYFFLEMNPRLYTSISVTVKSGLNYPLALCDLKNAKLPTTYKANVITRIWIAEKFAFFAYLFQKPADLKGFFKLKDTYFDDLSMKDPLPTIPLIVKMIRGKLL